MPETKIIQPEIVIINRKGSDLPFDERPATDKTREVQAYHDCAIFYLGKGNNKSDKPYGIVKSSISDEPFSMFRSGLSLYMNGGMVSVYGRQVEIKPLDGQSQIFIDDFTNETAFENLYINILVEINLNDITNQIARLIVSKRGAGYIAQSELAPYQYNFYKNKTGLYRIPLVHCQYHPTSSQPFNDFGFDCEVFQSETRSQAHEIKDGGTLAGDKLSDLFEGSKFLKNAINNNIYTYINSNANKEGDNAKKVPGYSKATETQKLGIGENAVEINENLEPLSVIKTQRVHYLFNTQFGAPRYSWTTKLSYNFQLDQAYEAYLQFQRFKLDATITYQYKDRATSDYPQGIVHPASSVTVKMDDEFKSMIPIQRESPTSDIVLYLYVDKTTFAWYGVPDSGYNVLSSCTLNLKQFKNGTTPTYPLSKITITNNSVIYEGLDGAQVNTDFNNWEKFSGLTLKSNTQGLVNLLMFFPAKVDLSGE